MRLGEGILVIINGLLLMQMVISRTFLSQRVKHMLSATGAAVTVYHLIYEGYRWQMLPVYVLIGAVMLPQSRRLENHKRWLTTSGTWGLIILGVGILLLVLLPVPKLPPPTGPYAIGTVTYAWTDPARVEIYGNSPGGPRKLMVQIWYPAEKTGARVRQQWLESTKTARAMAQRDHLPAFLIEQVKLTRTHTYQGAEFIKDASPYPVLIYIHGWAGFRNINQDQIEALVSSGYVVISADHAYGALITLFPDGTIADNDPQALNGDGTAPGKDEASNRLVRTFADDVRFIVDQAEKLNHADPDNRFAGRLDMSRIGVFGHSTGGGAAVQFCASDFRCKAFLGMDAWVEPVDEGIVQEGVSQPIMFLNSASWGQGPNRDQLRNLYTASPGPGYWIDIANTKHYDFVMVPTFSPIAPLLGFSGSLPAHTIMQINHTYLIAFFDRYLMEHNIPWLDSPPVDFPAVDITSK
ncbi:MAG: dienelactone hydrolase family protein [Anaerolineae bacterium]|nr:dienelactone hydrolase family protein [Anaerolineae bacterium]